MRAHTRTHPFVLICFPHNYLLLLHELYIYITRICRVIPAAATWPMRDYTGINRAHCGMLRSHACHGLELDYYIEIRGVSDKLWAATVKTFANRSETGIIYSYISWELIYVLSILLHKLRSRISWFFKWLTMIKEIWFSFITVKQSSISRTARYSFSLQTSRVMRHVVHYPNLASRL